MLRSASPPLLFLLLFLLDAPAGLEVEDLDEEDNPVLAPPNVQRTPQHLLRSAPCGPELHDFCQWGHCTLETRAEGVRVPVCTCFHGYSGERCSEAVAPDRELRDEEKLVKGKSLAQEILERDSRQSCSPNGQGGCGEEEEEKEKDKFEGELQTNEIPAENIEVYPCDKNANPCMNGAQCSVVIIDHSKDKKRYKDILCECLEGFEGEHCEKKVMLSYAS